MALKIFIQQLFSKLTEITKKDPNLQQNKFEK